MNPQQCFITFEDCSPGEARFAAQDLELSLVQAIPGITISRGSGNPRAQNIDSILSIVLPVVQTPIVVAFATALIDWLRPRRDMSITVRDGEREIILDHITYKDAERMNPLLAQFFSLIETPEKRKGMRKHARPTA